MDVEHRQPKLPLGMKFVYIEWIDSMFPGETRWMMPNEIDDFTNLYKDGIIQTIGMLYDESDKFVMIVNSTGSEGQQCSGMVMIPRCSILTMRRIEVTSTIDDGIINNNLNPNINSINR